MKTSKYAECNYISRLSTTDKLSTCCCRYYYATHSGTVGSQETGDLTVLQLKHNLVILTIFVLNTGRSPLQAKIKALCRHVKKSFFERCRHNWRQLRENFLFHIRMQCLPDQQLLDQTCNIEKGDEDMEFFGPFYV